MRERQTIDKQFLSTILVPARTHQMYNTSAHFTAQSNGHCRSLLWKCDVGYDEGVQLA